MKVSTKPPLLATLEARLRASPVPLTRRELLARWPGPAPRPDTRWRALARGVERGLFARVARGGAAPGPRADAGLASGGIRMTRPEDSAPSR